MHTRWGGPAPIPAEPAHHPEAASSGDPQPAATRQTRQRNSGDTDFADLLNRHNLPRGTYPPTETAQPTATATNPPQPAETQTYYPYWDPRKSARQRGATAAEARRAQQQGGGPGSQARPGSSSDPAPQEQTPHTYWGTDNPQQPATELQAGPQHSSNQEPQEQPPTTQWETSNWQGPTGQTAAAHHGTCPTTESQTPPQQAASTHRESRTSKYATAGEAAHQQRSRECPYERWQREHQERQAAGANQDWWVQPNTQACSSGVGATADRQQGRRPVGPTHTPARSTDRAMVGGNNPTTRPPHTHRGGSRRQAKPDSSSDPASHEQTPHANWGASSQQQPATQTTAQSQTRPGSSSDTAPQPQPPTHWDTSSWQGPAGRAATARHGTNGTPGNQPPPPQTTDTTQELSTSKAATAAEAAHQQRNRESPYERWQREHHERQAATESQDWWGPTPAHSHAAAQWEQQQPSSTEANQGELHTPQQTAATEQQWWGTAPPYTQHQASYSETHQTEDWQPSQWQGNSGSSYQAPAGDPTQAQPSSSSSSQFPSGGDQQRPLNTDPLWDGRTLRLSARPQGGGWGKQKPSHCSSKFSLFMMSQKSWGGPGGGHHYDM